MFYLTLNIKKKTAYPLVVYDVCSIYHCIIVLSDNDKPSENHDIWLIFVLNIPKPPLLKKPLLLYKMTNFP